MSDLRELSTDVLEVGLTLGLKIVRGSSLTPCPSCRATRRGSSDPRGPIGTTSNHGGFICHRCGTKGGSLNLAALVVTGSSHPSSWASVRERCERAGLLPTRGTRQVLATSRREAKRPPQEEVTELWARSHRVCDVPDVSIWLASRGFDPSRVEDFRLARALPDDCELPGWAWCHGASWCDCHYRLVVALCDSHGEVRSLHARAIRGDVKPKAVSPKGFQVAGLVMADVFTRSILKSGLPDWWEGRLELVVAEGLPDFLLWASRFSDSREYAPAVIGVISGSWTRELESRIPDATRIALRFHRDEAGRKYASQVSRELRARCEVAEWKT